MITLTQTNLLLLAASVAFIVFGAFAVLFVGTNARCDYCGRFRPRAALQDDQVFRGWQTRVCRSVLNVEGKVITHPGCWSYVSQRNSERRRAR